MRHDHSLLQPSIAFLQTRVNQWLTLLRLGLLNKHTGCEMARADHLDQAVVILLNRFSVFHRASLLILHDLMVAY